MSRSGSLVLTALALALQIHATTARSHRPTPTLRPVLNELSDDAHRPFADLGIYMTMRYIACSTNTVIVMGNCAKCGQSGKIFHTRILEHFLYNFNATITRQLFFSKPDDRPWDYNIFIVDSREAFNQLRFHLRETKREREFHFFIILTLKTPNRQFREGTMIEIFSACLHFNAYNVVIMTQLFDGSFGFFTYHLFGPNYCARVLRVDQFNSFRNGRLEHDLLFPERPLNLYGCTLKVSAHLLPPLLMFYGDMLNPNVTRDVTLLSGIEGHLLRVLSKAMNFSVKLSFPRVLNSIGTHNNSTGVFRELELQTADMAIGGLASSSTRSYIFSVSLSYYESPYVFIVRSGLHFGPLKQLAHSFETSVWLMIGGTILVAACFIKLLLSYGSVKVRHFVLGPHTDNPVINLFIILCGNPIKHLPRRNFARFLLMSWMLATLVLRNAYQAKMFDSLRLSRRVPTPRSIDELKSRDYIVLHSRFMTFYPPNKTMIMNDLNLRYSIIQNSNAKLATLSTLDTLAYYNQNHWNSSTLTYVDETIYLFQMALYFRKHSILRAMFDRRLQQLIDAGITSHIARQHVKIKYQLLKLKEQRIPRISNETLRGLYTIYYMMLITALFVFVLERMSMTIPRVKRLMDWVHFKSG